MALSKKVTSPSEVNRSEYSWEMMRRLLVPMVLFLAACGGANENSESKANSQQPTSGAVASTQPVEGQICADLGARGTSASQVELECQLMPDGLYVWRPPMNDPAQNSGAQSGLQTVFGGGHECDPSGPTEYTSPTGDVTKFAYIYPLGGMIGTHITPIDHIYVYYPGAMSTSSKPANPAGTYLVTAPADGRVISVEDFQVGNNYPYPDYRILIEHSCNLYSVFIHVGPLQGPLEPIIAEMGSKGIWTGSIEVKSGEVIADESGQPGYDFSTFSDKHVVALANPDSYREAENWKPYTSNPFDFFSGDVRSQLEAKSLRVKEPLGGTIEWDLVGTARGSWFVKDSNGYRGLGSQGASFDNHGKVAHGYWDTHLALAPDAVDESAFIFSIGDWEGCPCQFMSFGNSVDPATIKKSDQPTVIELVDFEQVNADGSRMDPSRPTKGYRLRPGTGVVGVLALQVLDDNTMKVEKLPGKKASDFTGFSDKAVIYVR